MGQPEPDRYMTLEQVIAFSGLQAREIADLVASERFPAPERRWPLRWRRVSVQGTWGHRAQRPGQNSQ